MRLTVSFLAVMAVGLSGCVMEDVSTGGARLTEGATQEAGQRGMDYLLTATVNWQTANRYCFACHTQGMSMWGASIGVHRGYTVDGARLGQIVSRVQNTQAAAGSWSHDGGISPRYTTAFAASGLAFYDRYVATDAQETFMRGVEWLRGQQAANGSWPSDSVWNEGRSEIFRAHDVFVTMSSVVAMARAFEITLLPVYRDARDRGVAWLRTAGNTSTQGLGFKLIGLMEGGTMPTDPVVVATRSQLLSYQNSDGGFGYASGQVSTPYHTGLAIYTLRLAGMPLSNTAIARGIQWLLDHQNANGSWSRGAAFLDASDPVAPSMWPVIALGEFGDAGVNLVASPTEIQIAVGDPDIQIVEYTITVTNTSSGMSDDTYDLAVTGGGALFSAALSQSQVTLSPGASQDVTLYVLAPANLPPGLPILHTVTATSQSNLDVNGSVTVNTYTPPVPPVVGHRTTTTLIDGVGITIQTGAEVRLAARVNDLDSGGAVVTGGGMGVVNFSVAGVAVGADTDSDGDGVFEYTWLPGLNWTHLGAQSVMAVYSGIDRPAPFYDLMSSYDIAGVEIEPTTGSACENTAIVVQEALTLLQAMDINIPDDAPTGIANKIREIIRKLEDVLARMSAGNCEGALSKLNTVFPQLDATIAQVIEHSCENHNGPHCIEDGLAAILIGDLQEARDLLSDVVEQLCAVFPSSPICQ